MLNWIIKIYSSTKISISLNLHHRSFFLQLIKLRQNPWTNQGGKNERQADHTPLHFKTCGSARKREQKDSKIFWTQQGSWIHEFIVVWQKAQAQARKHLIERESDHEVLSLTEKLPEIYSCWKRENEGCGLVRSTMLMRMAVHPKVYRQHRDRNLGV